MAHSDEALIDRPAYLPAERPFQKYFLMGRWFMLPVWMAILIGLCTLIMLASLNWDYHQFERKYLLAIIIGNVTSFGNMLFLLRGARLIRDRLPSVIALLPNADSRSESAQDLHYQICGRKRLAIWVLGVIALGEFTFYWIGIDMPTRTTKTLTVIAIVVIFGLLGFTVAFATGFWRWMHRFGKRRPELNVFHPDKMGGLHALSGVSDWVISVGAVLAALYGLGAYYAPYSHIQLKPYAYLWVAFAFVLVVLAFIIPAYSIHRCLLNAKQSAATSLNEQGKKIFTKFQSDSSGASSDIPALIWFTERLEKLNVWPYSQLPARLLSAAALQLAPLILKSVAPHVAMFKGS